MIRRSDFMEIGFLKKLNGTDGAFILRLNSQLEIVFKEEEPIFIEIEGNLVPFFIDEIHPHENSPIIHFDTINTREKAASFLGLKCFYSKSVVAFSDHKPEGEFLIGYTLHDNTSNLELTVTDVNLIPGNPLLEVKVGKHYHFIPYIETCIKSWDNKLKTLYCQYPEGLLESLLEL